MSTSANKVSTNGTASSRSGVRRIGIVGGGVAAWMAAAALAETLGHEACTIFVVGADDDGAAEQSALFTDATLPLDDGRLRIWWDEDRLIGAANGTFTWGIAFSGWTGQNTAWFHPFGSIGAGFGPVPFHHIAMRLRHTGSRMRLADYSLPALAAQAGRFARPLGDTHSVLSTCRYGLHLDSAGLASALRTTAEAAGVTFVPGAFAHAERAEDGHIVAVMTDVGQRLEGELFLDCTGDGALIGGHRTDWEDWSGWLPCDRLLTIRIDGADTPSPWSHAEAHAAGWTRYLPLDGSVALTSFHTASAAGEQAALESLRHAAGDAALANLQSAPLRFGRRREAWQKNCVALGPAAAMIEPLAVSNLHLLRSAILRLLELLPADPHAKAESREYNRRSAMELDNARDFAIALYKTNGRQGEAFWDERRAMSVPDALDHRMRLYANLGRVVLYDEEPLEDTSWISLFDEQGMRPDRYHPIAQGFTTENLQAHVARVRTIMIEELKKMPTHGEYLNRLKQALHSAGRESAP